MSKTVWFARSVVQKVPQLAPAARALRSRLERTHTSWATTWPQIVRARTEKITVAITAHCNLRCAGCRYGRDFMPGAILPFSIVRDLIDDAAEARVPAIRLYGGEPLLHPSLPDMLAHARDRGVGAYVTTNGLVLDRRIDALCEAGLRKVTIGYYGSGDVYDAYVQRPGRYARLYESMVETRRRHGPDALQIQFNFLLSRQSCNDAALDAALAFARRFDARIQIDLVHYSLPYFQEGPDRELQFRAEDEPAVRRMTEKLLAVKAAEPGLLTESSASLASIADWALKGPAMRIPCDAGKLLWVGADGSVKLCYVTFDLGNLHRERLRDILYTPQHHAAARSAFQLDCPNCHCERGARIEKHAPSFDAYSRQAALSTAE